MLDTEIDVPEVVNLVFFKQVRSRTKFWQMVGRGTRLCEDLFAPGQHKEFFYIFDFCENLEFFRDNPPVVEGSTNDSLSTRLFKTRLELIASLDRLILTELGPYELTAAERTAEGPTTNSLREGVVTLLQREIAAMNLENFVVRPKRRFVEKYASADA
jgi:type I restriction enzyme R subunit